MLDILISELISRVSDLHDRTTFKREIVIDLYTLDVTKNASYSLKDPDVTLQPQTLINQISIFLTAI